MVAISIEEAITSLADALAELDRIPVHDRAVVGFVAHALNNYLSVTDATLGLLADALRDHPHPEVDGWLAGLRRLGSMMRHTTGRLLRSASHGEFPLKPDYLDLPRLMQRACEHYRLRAQHKQLEIVCRSLGEIPQTWADSLAVAIVADNLLSNAVKFSKPGGEILVQILPGPAGVVCSVRDHGPGLTVLDRARLFDAAQPPTVATSGEPATGFGIAIAKGLVERMSGRLWVESEPGRGACFFFRLPYHPATRVEALER